MAVAELHLSNQNDKSREKSKDNKKERPSSKVVVRRLPPSMDQETFLVQVSPLPDYDYLYVVKGDMALGENAYARAYINFINTSDIFTFREKFDNYVFVDQKGHEYAAVVEFATFQKIPRKKKPRQDPKCGTIESDPYYLEFLESLKAQPNQDQQKPEFSYQFNADAKEDVASTPLLDFVKQRRIDKLRIREERREQRKQRETERKKLREEEQKRRQEQRFAAKSARSPKSLDSLPENPVEPTEKPSEETETAVVEKSSTPKDKKTYANSKPRFYSYAERSDYYEKRTEFKKGSARKEDNHDREFRNRRFDDYKKDTPRKTKKYSEKREERKNEVKRKLEESLQDAKEVSEISKKDNVETEKIEPIDSKKVLENQSSIEDDMKDRGEKDNRDDTRSQRRIRNKDRPSMAIYQPGMLSKKKVDDGSEAETANTTVKE